VPSNLGEVPEIERAFQIADRVNLTAKELEELEKREMFIQDQQGAILLAKKEGLAEGKQEGRKEKALEIASQLLDILDDETISQTTALPIEEIRNLRDKTRG
jgi:predicted transposase/invertase (TIGR01784 family)